MNVHGWMLSNPHSQYQLSEDVRIVAGVLEWAIYKLDTHDIIRVTPDEGSRIQRGDVDDFTFRKLMGAGIYRPVRMLESDTPPVTGDNESSSVIPFRSAWLELTGACNLFCSHCYMDAGRVRPESRVNWCAVLEYLAEHGCHQAIFIGGEPLCHPQFLEYVELSKRIAPTMRLCVVTNGTLWNEHLLEKMKKLDVFLKFSLLGSTSDRHDVVTGVPGSFNAAVKNIDLAIQLGVRLEISTALVPSSHETPESMSHFVTERFGRVKHSTTRVRPQGRQACGNPTDVCSEEKIAVHISKQFFDLATRRHPCLHGKVAFSYSGLVHPCIMSRFEQMELDVVLKQKPEEVFRKWWTLTKDKINGCRDCALRYACFDCRGFATSMTESPSNCRLAAELVARNVGT